MKEKLIIIGASGHGKVVLDIALRCNYEVLGFLDDDREKKELAGYPVLGSVDTAKTYGKEVQFIIGIGSNTVRRKIADFYALPWATLIHPNAVVGMGVSIGCGTVVMANTVINPFAEIGKHCILNTGCVIEHDNCISDYVHISPGAVLAGTVQIGEGTHIGAGAVVKNNICIAENCTIGVGAAVVKDLAEEGTYIGIPARRIEK